MLSLDTSSSVCKGMKTSLDRLGTRAGDRNVPKRDRNIPKSKSWLSLHDKFRQEGPVLLETDATHRSSNESSPTRCHLDVLVIGLMLSENVYPESVPIGLFPDYFQTIAE